MKTKYEVWYMKPDYFHDGILGIGVPNINDLADTHVHLKDVELDLPTRYLPKRYLENVYWQMQGENWSPRGEANGLIREKSLSHTSMSVGDIAVVNDEVYMVASAGFRHLGTREKK